MANLRSMKQWPRVNQTRTRDGNDVALLMPENRVLPTGSVQPGRTNRYSYTSVWKTYPERVTEADASIALLEGIRSNQTCSTLEPIRRAADSMPTWPLSPYATRGTPDARWRHMGG